MKLLPESLQQEAATAALVATSVLVSPGCASVADNTDKKSSGFMIHRCWAITGPSFPHLMSAVMPDHDCHVLLPRSTTLTPKFCHP
jgi:hypothetical protein